METSKEMSERFDRELRISKSGYSIKKGDRIVAVMPERARADSEVFKVWIDDAADICDAYNAAISSKEAGE